MANDFGWALNELRAGMRACRAGWNGKGMWLVIVHPPQKYIQFAFGKTIEPGHELLPYVGMKTVDNKFVPWLCSQTDMLAEDWELAE